MHGHDREQARPASTPDEHLFVVEGGEVALDGAGTYPAQGSPALELGAVVEPLAVPVPPDVLAEAAEPSDV